MYDFPTGDLLYLSGDLVEGEPGQCRPSAAGGEGILGHVPPVTWCSSAPGGALPPGG